MTTNGRPIEGDDSPLRVILFGSQFAAVDDGETLSLSASGPRALQSLASQLLQAGFDPDRALSIYRGGQHIGRQSISAAAQEIA